MGESHRCLLCLTLTKWKKMRWTHLGVCRKSLNADAAEGKPCTSSDRIVWPKKTGPRSEILWCVKDLLGTVGLRAFWLQHVAVKTLHPGTFHIQVWIPNVPTINKWGLDCRKTVWLLKLLNVKSIEWRIETDPEHFILWRLEGLCWIHCFFPHPVPSSFDFHIFYSSFHIIVILLLFGLILFPTHTLWQVRHDLAFRPAAGLNVVLGF